jgi:hypothetical protein
MRNGSAEHRKPADECRRQAMGSDVGVFSRSIFEAKMVISQRAAPNLASVAAEKTLSSAAQQPPKNPRVRLRKIPAPAIGEPLVHAPPTLIASTHTIDFECANCGAVLLRAEEGQVHNLVIHCQQCG